MKKLSYSAAAICLSLLTLAGAKAQTTIAGWTFDNITTNSYVPNPTPSTDNSAGAVSAADLGMGIYSNATTGDIGTNDPDVTLGKTSDKGSNGVSDVTNQWRIRAQGTNSANGWSSLAPIGTQGAQFNVSTVGFNSITVSFDWYATTQGEANLQFEYTTNGTTWINAALALSGSDNGLQLLSNNGSDTNTVTGSYVSDNLLANGSPAGQDWFTGLTATISDTNAANDANFGFRMVNASTGADDVSTAGTALNNTSGNWRFDNVTVSGVSAVPEPSTYALFFGGVALLAGVVIRRKVFKS
jgi:hypothetical protein